MADEVVQAMLTWCDELDSRRIAPRASGPETRLLFGEPLPEEGFGARASDILPLLLEHSRAQNGRFFGYVLGSAEPIGVLGDLLASAVNQNVTAWRSSPAATVVERTLVAQLGGEIGCEGYAGSFCGGGSSANLMGLAMARESRCPANETGARPGLVYASTEVHMSIPKAMALLGLGRDNLRLVPVDDGFKMRVDALEQAIRDDLAAGLLPIAVVANAGTTNTGAVDPLQAIASITREHNVHLHVDGAYGGFAVLGDPDRIGPLKLADTIALDAHKWLYQPMDCGLFLFRDPMLAHATFAYTGDYTRTFANDPLEAFAFFEESIELSRRFRALKLWLSLRFHGLAAYRASIREDLDLAQQLAQMIVARDEFELLAPVELSAVCFRLRGRPNAELDALNQSALRRVNERGRVYLSNATINGQFALRACITNHRTSTTDIETLLDELLSVATEL
jgi:glutamate/tyrosine decarboxylase-like PLP-dependent enzyme